LIVALESAQVDLASKFAKIPSLQSLGTNAADIESKKKERSTKVYREDLLFKEVDTKVKP
jgi:hypothetical protein